MNKIGYIIRREYLTRVRKRTFWILTFLIPILYALLIGFSVYMQTSAGKEKQQVSIIDYSKILNQDFEKYFPEDDELEYIYLENGDTSMIKESLKTSENAHLLIVPAIEDIYKLEGFEFYSSKNSSTKVVNRVNNSLNNKFRDMRMKDMHIAATKIDSLEPNINLYSDITLMTEDGAEKDNRKVAKAIGSVAGFLNYMFIFIYGGLVLRGVHEEKSNRIVEIIVSSVKPFELMFGKIVGIVLVGLSQFLIWILFIFLITTIASSLSVQGMQEAQEGVSAVVGTLKSLNIGLIIGVFIFYFIGGYLLYSSMFASIAAAVDNQSDIQQFMLPLSLPLILAIISLQGIIQAPHSPFAVWLSMIPFTSPIIMIVRVAFWESFTFELLISMIIMIGSFIFTTWVAAKIYRIGILITGTKVTYKDLWKWLFY
jgi:ABC-2 type transport system permease protein